MQKEETQTPPQCLATGTESPPPARCPLLSLPNELHIIIGSELSCAELRKLIATCHKVKSAYEYTLQKKQLSLSGPHGGSVLHWLFRGTSAVQAYPCPTYAPIILEAEYEKIIKETLWDFQLLKTILAKLRATGKLRQALAATTAKERTPLYFALAYGPAIVAELLEVGADANVEDQYGYTPLHYVLCCSPVAMYVRRKGRDWEFGQHRRLGQGSRWWSTPSCRKADFEIARLLVQHGANVNVQQMRQQWGPFSHHLGYSLLHYAVPDSSDGFPVGEALIEMGADPTLLAANGMQARDLARTGYIDQYLAGTMSQWRKKIRKGKKEKQTQAEI